MEKVNEWAKDFKTYVDELQMPRDDYKGIMEYIDDAVALLKEQEDLGTELTNAVELIHKKNERIEKLLKEQEPKFVLSMRECETLPNHYERKGFCPKCHQVVEWNLNRAHCGFCGQAVKWE